jgi:predicted membrane protein
MAESRMTGKLIVGLAIVALGVMFLLDNFGYLDAGDVLVYWPVVFVVVGLTQLLGSPRRLISGMVFVILGCWLLANQLGYLEQSPWDMWPVFLILAGATLVGRGLRKPAPAPPGVVDDTRINSFALMSGTTRKVVGDFLGADLTAIMGGHDIDLRNARIPNGGTVIIDVFVWWGGIDLKVPPDWKVSNEGLAVMGAFEDNSTPPQPADVRGTLVLKGLVVMGGVETKN